MKNVEIPKKETKSKALHLPVTPTEQKTILRYCRDKKVKLTDLIRFAIKNTYDLNF